MTAPIAAGLVKEHVVRGAVGEERGWETGADLLAFALGQAAFEHMDRRPLRLDVAHPPSTLARALWSVASRRRCLRQRRVT